MASRIGVMLPDLELTATNGSSVNLAKSRGTSVVFCYPFTGRPNHPNPPNWDNIPGAHGSTPQALGFSKLYTEFATLNVSVFGVSFQPTEWQKDFAMRNALPYLLLSDGSHKFAKALNLDCFQAGSETFLSRRCLIIKNSIVQHDIFPVHYPEQNAAEILQMLQP